MKFSLLSALQEPGNISIAFQPVFELVDRPNPIHALDASIRGPQGTHFEKSTMLLEYVRRKKAEPLIDRDVVSAICRAAETLPRNTRIHVPVHTATLAQNPGFANHLELQANNHDLGLDRFTVELIESQGHTATHSVIASIDALRQLGARIGLCGVGLGNSVWQMLIERSPEYWKLAPYLVQGITEDFKKRSAVEAILEVAKRFGSMVVATEVTNAEDLATLAMLGVQLVEADFLCQAISVDALLRSGVLSDCSAQSGDDQVEGSAPMFAG